MKRFLKSSLSVLILLILIVAIFPSTITARPASFRAIVVFDDAVNQAAQEEIIARTGSDIQILEPLPLVNGITVVLPSKAYRNVLLQQQGVKRVDEDIQVFATVQTLPWGIDKIDADLAWGITKGTGVKVAILDTGIDLKHPDLKENIKGGYNALNPARPPSDGNGHGTHVAGIVAARDNDIGVVGVAPEASLYAVKVLSNGGFGWLSDIIEGLDWAARNGMQVVNMSFGSSSGNDTFHEAIANASYAGVTLVAAAGNGYGGPVIYPAAYPEVVAVSATTESDAIASFSSVGPEVDLAAPGQSIYSTYKNGSYATLSGTSMASPHIAGSAALVIASGKASTPTGVQTRLEGTAVDLGPPGKDIYYGAGRVNAYAAVAP